MNASAKLINTQPDSRLEALSEMIAELGHYLPSQPPLHAFVHHNTLHHFEHLRFEDAVVKAGKLFDAEPYLKESEYHQFLERNRITALDIDASVTDYLWEFPYPNDSVLNLSAKDFFVQRLQKFIPVPEGATIDYLIDEQSLLGKLSSLVSTERATELSRVASLHTGEPSVGKAIPQFLQKLWKAFKSVNIDFVTPPPQPKRLRDYILGLTNSDTDELVNPILIRMSAAYLDQGIAHWSMPDREQGLLHCFKTLYSQPFSGPNTLLKNLRTLLERPEIKQASALEVIDWALKKINISTNEESEFLLHTLLALRGWAGMIQHFEQRPDRAPVQALNARLNDFLAMRLLLEVVVGEQLLHQHCAIRFDFTEIKLRYSAQVDNHDEIQNRKTKIIYEAFIAAQFMPVSAELLFNDESALTWIKHIHHLDDTLRRRLLHLAFEGYHRDQTLTALQIHSKTVLPTIAPQKKPIVQAVFCIDDREESVRRHIEEILPNSETLGFAGFFGAAIQYQGMHDIRSKPLCPVVITPKHFIQEVAENTHAHTSYKFKQKKIGQLKYHRDVSSRTLTRGTIYTALLGWFSIVPLILRSVSPSLYIKIEHLLHASVGDAPKSRLIIESEHEHEEPLKTGYSVKEMSDIVETTLKTLNILHNVSNLVFFVGHGSCSLNNPHEAAHDCGATGGGRGGPNARTFAAMANHPLVRQTLALRGLAIPETSWFIGAYHNTCDDSFTYYDEDLLPETLSDQYQQVKSAFDRASMLDAHERCRRFETTPNNISVNEALEYAQIHSNDLAEPRPEYGHATNSICIVGRRARSRGLFLDRRAFLVSYDPTADANGQILKNLLMAVGPVGAGINLEYYFSFIDPVKYGCGTKLPHNISGLVGVMDGHATDLRTGLPWQMVEIHEPVRLLVVVESTPEQLEQILNTTPSLVPLILNRWIQVAALDPHSDQCFMFTPRGFVPHIPTSEKLEAHQNSAHYYCESWEFLAPTQIFAAMQTEPNL